MDPSSAAPALMFLLIISLTAGRRVSSEPQTQPTCPWEFAPFIRSLQHQCPISISPNPPIEVNGDFLDLFLDTNHQDRYTSILFHASWCPFSQAAHSTYEALSSMFPQIDHLTVEQSSAMPSLFSRYGIHSVPTILLVNQTSRFRYHGPRTLISLTQFYEQNTGIEPVAFMLDQPMTLQTNKAPMMNFLSGLPVKEIARKEPYLTAALLFLCLRLLFALSPKILSHLKAFWVSYIPHLNLGIFSETSQIFVRIFPAVDIKRMWTKLGVFKVRNFYASARNARVWTSSLASVTIGGSSSARSL